MFIFNIDKLKADIIAKRTMEDLDIRLFSTKLNISPATLSRIENGKMLDLLTYYKVCRYLEKPMNYYFDEYNDKLKDILKDICHEMVCHDNGMAKWSADMFSKIDKL